GKREAGRTHAAARGRAPLAFRPASETARRAPAPAKRVRGWALLPGYVPRSPSPGGSGAAPRAARRASTGADRGRASLGLPGEGGAVAGPPGRRWDRVAAHPLAALTPTARPSR